MARNVLYTALHDKTTKISVIKLKKKKKKTQTIKDIKNQVILEGGQDGNHRGWS